MSTGVSDLVKNVANATTEYCIAEGDNSPWVWESKFAELLLIEYRKHFFSKEIFVLTERSKSHDGEEADIIGWTVDNKLAFAWRESGGKFLNRESPSTKPIFELK